jgi:RimJ/RimL family protein N-acetyltransferase
MQESLKADNWIQVTQFKSAPTLETERLVLRGHRSDDFQDSADMWADPQVTAHIYGVPSTREQSWSRFLRYAGHWSHLGFGYWVVETRADAKFVGEVGFADYRRNTTPSIEGFPEAGWVFKTHVHGKGYATEAVSRMLRWADLELNGAKTVCIFDPTHTASINVAKKNGYGDELIGNYEGNETLFMERRR